MSARLAAKVTGSTSGGPPLLGSAVAVAVGLAVAVAVAVGLAVAVAVGLAVMAPPCCSAKAADANGRTSTALTVSKSKTFFMKHLLYLNQVPFRANIHLFPSIGFYRIFWVLCSPCQGKDLLDKELPVLIYPGSASGVLRKLEWWDRVRACDGKRDPDGCTPLRVSF
jgi:hypothetical protein